MDQEKLKSPSLTALLFANLGINTVAASQAVARICIDCGPSIKVSCTCTICQHAHILKSQRVLLARERFAHHPCSEIFLKAAFWKIYTTTPRFQNGAKPWEGTAGTYKPYSQASNQRLHLEPFRGACLRQRIGRHSLSHTLGHITHIQYPCDHHDLARVGF